MAGWLFGKTGQQNENGNRIKTYTLTTAIRLASTVKINMAK
jgi:hypothetical protein